MSFSELKFATPSVSLIYFAIVIGFFIIVLFILLQKLRKATTRREEQFKNKKNEVPISNPTKTMKKRSLKRKRSGLESIESQFTITRKILIPSVLIFCTMFALIPFLDKIPAAILSIFIGGISLILGLIVRPLLENAFAGLVISYSKSLNIGDTVLIDEYYGIVADITMSYTTIKTWDWNRYVIPNSKMLQKEFTNLTLVDKYQLSYIEFFVSYDSDIEVVKKLALDCANKSSHTIEDNIPDFWVMDMNETCYKCWIASWTENTKEAWSFKSEIRIELINAFKMNKINSYSVNYYKNQKPQT